MRFIRPRFVLLLLGLSFLLFFAVERLLGSILPHHDLPLIPTLSTLISIVLASATLPLLLRVLVPPPAKSKEHARFVAAAESSLDDFYIFDGIPDASGQIVDFRFNYVNPNAERRLKRSRHELEGKILTEVRPFMLTSGLIEDYREVVRTGRPFIREIFLDDHMIQATWIHVQVVKLGDGIAITSRDIDNFKTINDTLGHSTGDALLTAIAQRLLSAVRETDTVARVGGDEFVIVMPEFKSLEDVLHCGREIVEKTVHPIPVDGREIAITLSIGLCIYPDSGLDEDQILRNADAAMYTVKTNGRNGLHLFTPGK